MSELLIDPASNDILICRNALISGRNITYCHLALLSEFVCEKVANFLQLVVLFLSMRVCV